MDAIKKDITKNFDITTIDETNPFAMHWGICMYIRNKYLWQNKPLVEILNKHFNTKEPDELSHKIFHEIKKEVLSQSSKPNK